MGLLRRGRPRQGPGRRPGLKPPRRDGGGGEAVPASGRGWGCLTSWAGIRCLTPTATHPEVAGRRPRRARTHLRRRRPSQDRRGCWDCEVPVQGVVLQARQPNRKSTARPTRRFLSRPGPERGALLRAAEALARLKGLPGAVWDSSVRSHPDETVLISPVAPLLEDSDHGTDPEESCVCSADGPS